MRKRVTLKRTVLKFLALSAYLLGVVVLSTGRGASQGSRFEAGDTIPGFVLRAPSGSVADVRAVGTYDRTRLEWTVILSRALVIRTPDEDVQFDELRNGRRYLFSAAVLDNSIGKTEVMMPQDSTPYRLGIDTGMMGAKPDLVAVRAQSAPARASDFTGPTLSTKGGEVAGIRVPHIALQAAYDDGNIYILARWFDATESVFKEQWVFDGTKWIRTSRDINDEDRLAIWFNINAVGFETMGCGALCHTVRMQTMNPDGHADLWQWKAARTNPLGLASDEKAAPVRADDSGVGIATANERAGLPAFMAENDPGANARFLIQIPKGAKRSAPFAQ